MLHAGLVPELVSSQAHLRELGRIGDVSTTINVKSDLLAWGAANIETGLIAASTKLRDRIRAGPMPRVRQCLRTRDRFHKIVFVSGSFSRAYKQQGGLAQNNTSGGPKLWAPRSSSYELRPLAELEHASCSKGGHYSSP